jgi:hypothetical protein
MYIIALLSFDRLRAYFKNSHLENERSAALLLKSGNYP